MIATITDVILARSDSAAQSRKYWKKHGKKINIRKRQRRKSGTSKTAYTAGDYKWVTNTINQYQKNGISLKGLWKISSEQPRLGLRSELPPGRDKISQIVADGNGTDWKVSKFAGGRGNRTVILPLQPDEIRVIERLGYGIIYCQYFGFLPKVLFHLCFNILSPQSNPTIRKTLAKLYRRIFY